MQSSWQLIFQCSNKKLINIYSPALSKTQILKLFQNKHTVGFIYDYFEKIKR